MKAMALLFVFLCAWQCQAATQTPLRGVMLPIRNCVETDFATLHGWKVTLVRYQMVRGWFKENDNQDLQEFDLWLNGRLDHLENAVLPMARKYGMRVVVDLHVPPGGICNGEMNMFHEKRWADHFVACWERIARHFKGRSEIYGFDLINEPLQMKPSPDGLDYWTVQLKAAEAIRKIDLKTPIIIEANDRSLPDKYVEMRPMPVSNVIYQVHMYHPIPYTHQGVSSKDGKFERLCYPDAGKGWDRGYLKDKLAPVRAFQLKYGAKIYVGEFSAIAWAGGADSFLADCISVFEEYGWDWTYHAFREWDGWSVEHEGTDAAHLHSSADNSRKRVLLRAFKSKSH